MGAPYTVKVCIKVNTGLYNKLFRQQTNFGSTSSFANMDFQPLRTMYFNALATV
jgi:hypothetical protein